MAPLLNHSCEALHEDDTHYTLQGLIQDIHNVLGPDGGLDSEHIDHNEIISLMEKYGSNVQDWEKYTLFDRSRPYTRNLIDDGNGKFNLMILAWSEERHSPIHDHAGSHCIMKVLDGHLQETLYEYPSKVVEDNTVSNVDITADTSEDTQVSTTYSSNHPLQVTKDTILQPNQVAYIHDKIGLHRIANPSGANGAVSLHLYTPPYKTCKTFEESTGKARSASQCTFYSIKGARQEKGLL
ncbi:RmlC-like cupin domain-containing protein [Absidia repens]|uniref:Cysteine dioxygenase n=1 Tax=Absidia repens TaxID=90262 RepID=A0A1X2IA79_9FUNG|nr:RmlC-like cupin domain-containing protein [Absidia repens]